jgi:AmiR/NasT family two-component response regulator
MERFGINDNQAFQLLRKVSSHTSIKLQRVAVDLVRTRRLPPT